MAPIAPGSRELEGLLAREDWIFPKPRPKQGPMHGGAVRHALPPEVQEEALAKIDFRMPEWFGKRSPIAFEAVRSALEHYAADRSQDWDRRAEIRDQRGHEVQRRRLAVLAQHLEAAGELLTELGNDGTRRLRELIHPFGARPGAAEELEELAAEVSTAARAAALELRNGARLRRRGRRPELARRWLVYRLKLVWDTFAADSFPGRRRGPDPEIEGAWPLRDFVELVLALVGGGGEAFLRELVYPGAPSAEEKAQLSPDPAE